MLIRFSDCRFEVVVRGKVARFCLNLGQTIQNDGCLEDS